MGTPDISKEALENIYNAGFEIVGVVTQPDRPSGRGMKVIYSPVKEYALEKGFKIFQPEKISKNDEFKDEIRALDVDLVVVVSYGVILPKSFINIPKLGCVNLHPSMLPKYRGPAPIQWAILNGDEKTGVTIMYINEKMDAGDIIVQEEVDIDPDETTGDLWARLSKIGARMLVESIKKIEDGTVSRTPQPEEFTLAPFLDKEMSKINYEEKTSKEIKNLVRGLNPIMGTFSFLNDKKIKFWKVDSLEKEEFENIVKENNFVKYEDSKPGEVLFSSDRVGLFIRAKEGIVSVLEIQGENSKKMNVKDFLRGNHIEMGEFFK